MAEEYSQVVAEISKMNLVGNIVPHTWYKHLTYDNGKPYVNAILILSDIVYWYRAREIRDEYTGKVIGYQKRFKADKLQRNYQNWSEMFGFSKKQIYDAMKYLRNHSYITVELRDLKTKQGYLSNVMFVEPVPSKIKDITYNLLDEHKNLQIEDQKKEGGTYL